MIIKDTMTDYKQGKIYAIRSSKTDKYYIGSTATTLCKRFYSHKTKQNITASAEIIAFGDAYIELIELFPCGSKMELNKREGELQREMKTNIVNKYFAHTSPEQRKEQSKKYSSDNKEKIKNYSVKHRDENKEELRVKQAEYRLEHREELRVKNAEYRANNKEKTKLRNAKRYKKKELQVLA